MTEAEQQHIYEQRVDRFQKLVALNAPKSVIGREALLIAAITISKDLTVQGLVPVINEDFVHTEVPSRGTLTKHPFVATPNGGTCSSCGLRRSDSVHI
jgi:hypothetical protein